MIQINLTKHTLIYLSHPGSRTALGSKKVLYAIVMPPLANAVTWSKVKLKTGFHGDLKNGEKNQSYLQNYANTEI